MKQSLEKLGKTMVRSVYSSISDVLFPVTTNVSKIVAEINSFGLNQDYDFFQIVAKLFERHLYICQSIACKSSLPFTVQEIECLFRFHSYQSLCLDSRFQECWSPWTDYKDS